MKTRVGTCVAIGLLSCVAACGGAEPTPVAPASSGPIEPLAPAQVATVPTDMRLTTESAIGIMKPDFRLCYEEGVKRNPKLEGSVVVEVKIDLKGHVTDSTVLETKGLSPEVAQCIEKRVDSGVFPASEKESTLRIPVSFKAGE